MLVKCPCGHQEQVDPPTKGIKVLNCPECERVNIMTTTSVFFGCELVGDIGFSVKVSQPFPIPPEAMKFDEPIPFIEG